MKKHIPNALTLANLLAGCVAVVCLLYQHYAAAVLLLLAGGVADFADGFVARMLKVQSAIGRELDSLADMVSFGLAPGVILYMMLQNGGEGEATELYLPGLPAFLLTGASALRLAKFNIDSRQTDQFLGLPTPAATMLVVGLLLWYQQDVWGCRVWLSQPVSLYGLVAVLSYLLLSELPMFSFKFKKGGWQGNEIRIIFAVVALVSLLLAGVLALAPLIFGYILLNVIRYFLKFNA
jgi:CDP-diacylglycerol---serine O-phosphatidyltransferase